MSCKKITSDQTKTKGLLQKFILKGFKEKILTRAETCLNKILQTLEELKKETWGYHNLESTSKLHKVKPHQGFLLFFQLYESYLLKSTEVFETGIRNLQICKNQSTA